MWDDRSTVVTNVKNIQNITTLEPADTLVPGGDEAEDTISALGATGTKKDVANLSEVDLEGKDREHYTELINSKEFQDLTSKRRDRITVFRNLKDKSDNFLPKGNSNFTQEFKKLTRNQTWNQLNEHYKVPYSKSQTPKTGDTKSS